MPIDPSEGPTQIKAWGAASRPAYGLLMGLTETQVASVKSLVLDQMKLDAVPASIVTAAAGNVLLTQWGPPSISKLRELLAAVRSEGRCPPALRCGN